MNLKKLMEKRAALQEEMKKLLDTAGTETRALSDEEVKKFDELEKEVRSLDDTIKRMQATRKFEPVAEPQGDDSKPTKPEEREYKIFEAFVRDKMEELRDLGDANTDAPMKFTDNGAVIPTSIANKIIDKVVEMCPIYHDATRYNVKGTLQIPYYDNSTGDITMEYVDEFTDGDSTSGKFKSISLKGFLARAICDISKSLINNSQFDIVNFCINKMSEQIARFIERELLHGTTDKVDGLSGVTNIITSDSKTAITADEIIDLQEAIPDIYQAGAYFIMNKSTRTAIRKLKDGDGNYLLNKDATTRWGYTLFGKDVYTSDNMDGIEAGKVAIYYGDFTGLAVKVSEEINIEILRETKAKHHAIEILGFVEFDSKVENAQKIAALKIKAN